MTERKVPVQSLIDHIKTAIDVDPWAKEMVEDLLKEQEAVEPFHKCINKDFTLIEDSHFDYCPYCGKPIAWAKLEGRRSK